MCMNQYWTLYSSKCVHVQGGKSFSFPDNKDVGHSKLLSQDTHCDHCKSLVSIYQKKAFCKLNWVLPLFCCPFTLCRKYAHLNFFSVRILIGRNYKGVLFILYRFERCIKSIQLGKMWCDFPVVIVRKPLQRASCFKNVNLPELILTKVLTISLRHWMCKIKCGNIVPPNNELWKNQFCLSVC